MIKGITQNGKYMTVSGGQAGSTYVNNYSGAQGIGNMRFNTSNQNYEVWDGNSWVMLPSTYATVGLTSEAEELLDWARQKRNDELRIKALAEKHPGIRDLQEKLDIMIALVKEQDSA